KTANTDQKAAEARLVVLGNSDFASDGLFDQQLNGDVFLNSVSWLSKQDEQLLSIRPKEVKDRRINLSQEQANLLGWIAVLIMPLIGFITAGLVWWFRR
ncbi:MAG: ABC transporter, partial [Cyanobacteriota bacterium]